MSVIEIRDPDEARLFCLQSMLCRRLGNQTQFFPEAIRTAHEMASESHPLLPLGMIADIGQLALGVDSRSTDPVGETLSTELMRLYEDFFLGKFYADGTFERGSVAIARYRGRDQMRALAFLVHRIQARAGLPAVQINPSILRNLTRMTADDLLLTARELKQRLGLSPVITNMYEQCSLSIRLVGDLLGNEDIFELESGTALGGFGQRIALRQVMRFAGECEKWLARRPVVHEANRRQLVATRLQDEDAYPVGGFTSISTRGSIESLLHSQLVYMEREDAERPDLFDIKFLRDELLYYARDENQFLRQRRTYYFAFDPQLEKMRVKDEHARYQRIIHAIGAVDALIHKMIEWLTTDALRFEIVFIGKHATQPAEQELLNLISKERVEQGLANVRQLGVKEFLHQLEATSQHTLCHLVTISARKWVNVPEHALTSHLRLTQTPQLVLETPPPKINGPISEWEEIVPALAEYLML